MTIAPIKPMIVDEFDEWVMLPENIDKNYEFIGGRVVQVVSQYESSEIGVLVGGLLAIFVRERKLGYVTGSDGGYHVMGERYIPDAAYISRTRQPTRFRGAYNPLAPYLAIEVLSPSNSDEDMRVKIANYLRAGTTVWRFNPDPRSVEIHAPGREVVHVDPNGVMEGGDLVPGFSFSLPFVFDSEAE